MGASRKSVSKSRKGCRTCKIRHVKCDELRPRCQRCVSTGRKCDGYLYSGTSTRQSEPVTDVLDTPARDLRCANTSDGLKEHRSFEFFRLETVPGIGGFFGIATWKLVLQACDQEPVVRQAAIALGALHEKMSLQSSCDDGSTQIETEFPLMQHGKAMATVRKYLANEKTPRIDVILMSALIFISIEVMQVNYLNASVHLEKSLPLLGPKFPNHTPDIDPDLSLAFRQLDLHASKYQGKRSPVLAHLSDPLIPSRFSSIAQAKETLANLTIPLYAFVRSIAEEYKYRKLQDVPIDAVTTLSALVDSYGAWKDRFDKFLHRSTSRFSLEEQSIVDVLIINHRIDYIEAATCIHPDAMIFDEFDDEFDEIVTLAAKILRSRKQTSVMEFRLDIGIIYPLFCTAVRCRDRWIRQRAMSLLRSIRFQEGVWSAKAQTSIAQVAINREESFSDPSLPDQRPLEFARVHSIGINMDPVKRVAEVNLTQKLNGLDGPWHDHIEWCSW